MKRREWSNAIYSILWNKIRSDIEKERSLRGQRPHIQVFYDLGRHRGVNMTTPLIHIKNAIREEK